MAAWDNWRSKSYFGQKKGEQNARENEKIKEDKKKEKSAKSSNNMKKGWAEILILQKEFEMDKTDPKEISKLETVEPIGNRVLISKDKDKKETKGGIQLPDNIEIPTITGRIVEISAEVENSPDIPLRKYDKVLFNPKGAIPVDFEGDNRLFVVEVENVVAVFRTS